MLACKPAETGRARTRVNGGNSGLAPLDLGAQLSGADLAVLGSHFRSIASRVLEGTVAERRDEERMRLQNSVRLLDNACASVAGEYIPRVESDLVSRPAFPANAL